MCGIGGLVSLEKQHIPDVQIKQLMDIVAHRGPDDDGFLVDNNVALGHRRLSILDLSKDGHQPMQESDHWIVYNGEVYNYLELREELQQLGATFRSNTDTEVILRAYREWGYNCVKRFNGMWSFAIYDKPNNVLFCCRDRFGVKPFYYTVQGNYFAFGSEIKQFTTLPGWQAIGNKREILNFVFHGIFDYSSDTFFKDVYQLSGGHYLIFDLKKNTKTITEWYDLRKATSNVVVDRKGDSSQFLNLLSDSVRLRLRSDVKVGSCLSGGLDSSTIVCLVNQILRQQDKSDIQETVSSCFQDKVFDERYYIDQVAMKTQVKSHRIFPNMSELTTTIEKLTWHMDSPFTSASPFAQWNIFSKARELGLIVMLDGQGADEQLAGYQIFYDVYMFSLFRGGKFRKLLNEYSALRKVNKITIKQLAINLFKSISLRIPIIKKFIKGTTYSWFRHQVERNPFHPYNEDSIKQLSLQQLYQGSLPMLLHYEDRNSMAFSVESRVPFLDYRLAEYLITIPPEEKLEQGRTKVIMRNAMSSVLPEVVVNRQDKMAFVTPESLWVEQNADFVEKNLLHVAEYINDINPIELVRVFREQTVKGIRPGSVYWRLMSLGIWLKVFNIERVK